MLRFLRHPVNVHTQLIFGMSICIRDIKSEICAIHLTVSNTFTFTDFVPIHSNKHKHIHINKVPTYKTHTHAQTHTHTHTHRHTHRHTHKTHT